MKEIIMLKPYCLIGMGDITNLKEDIASLSEANANYVCGEGLIITTFRSSLHMAEIEEFLNINNRSFIIFEMIPGFFSASIQNKKFQDSLFGGKIDNSFLISFKIVEGLREMVDSLKEELIEDFNFDKKDKKDKKDLTLNEILDRINEVGLPNLTSQEKELLEKYSN